MCGFNQNQTVNVRVSTWCGACHCGVLRKQLQTATGGRQIKCAHGFEQVEIQRQRAFLPLDIADRALQLTVLVKINFFHAINARKLFKVFFKQGAGFE